MFQSLSILRANKALLTLLENFPKCNNVMPITVLLMTIKITLVFFFVYTEVLIYDKICTMFYNTVF